MKVSIAGFHSSCNLFDKHDSPGPLCLRMWLSQTVVCAGMHWYAPSMCNRSHKNLQHSSHGYRIQATFQQQKEGR